MSNKSSIVDTAIERVEMPLAEDFRIARGSQESVTNHLVTLTDEAGRTGIGACAPSAYYDETPDSVADALPSLLEIVEDVADPFAQQELEDRLRDAADSQPAARAGVSLAVHDLVARLRDEPLFGQWGLDPSRMPATSYTVGIATPEEMADRARRYRDAGFGILKVKLGTGADRERLTAVREAVPDARIRVDANADWDVETALATLDWLDDLDVEFLEQPVPADDTAGLRTITHESPFPVAADESCVDATDVPTVSDAVDIVVVKLMKCGGIRPALRQIETARAHGLDVMLGCMVESAASIAGACHLAPLVTYADLDGSLLLDSDPVDGIPVQDGTFDIGAVTAGTGAGL
jgi:L-alanine-DL-glutamate epimerase-like enolase superfamily enzyme